MLMQSVRVNLGPRSYDIAIGSGIEAEFTTFVRQHLPQAARAVVVADTNTAGHARRLATRLGTDAVAVVPAGEGSKSLANLADLLTTLAGRAADRQTPIVAVGGGVIGDLVGFAAATYNRGIPL